MDRGVITDRNIMLCPDCRAENIEGADVCGSCGADLRNLKLPTPVNELEQKLIGGHLNDLGAAEAHTVSPGDPVFLAIHFMRDKHVECVLVRDKSQNIVGILTERDIMMKAAGPNRDLMAMAVQDIMTPDPVMLREEDTLAVALHKMAVGGFRHIPFINHDGTTLLFSIQDIFRHVAPYIPHQ